MLSFGKSKRKRSNRGGVEKLQASLSMKAKLAPGEILTHICRIIIATSSICGDPLGN